VTGAHFVLYKPNNIKSFKTWHVQKEA